MVVTDASAIVELLVGSRLAPALRDRLLGEDVHAPYIVEVEALQALRRLARSERLSEDRAATARDHLNELPLVLYPHRPLMERAWELRHALSAYDACYVALGEALDAPVMTCDARLASASSHRTRIELFE